ncbi:MAG: hypothetical protein WAM04_20365 [Candidatus Sulfotelmatobacter sp.]
MATSIRTHFVGGAENELLPPKKPSQPVTDRRGGGGGLAKLWELLKPRKVSIRDVEKARPLEKRDAGSVSRIPASWSEVISDPVLWKEMRDVLLDDTDDHAA